MNCLAVLFVLLVIVGFIYFCLSRGEFFQLDHYLRRNYESGANMLRGDLPLYPTRQSWFNTRYGPSSIAPGFFNMRYNPSWNV